MVAALFGKRQRIAAGLGTDADGLEQLGRLLAWMRSPQPPRTIGEARSIKRYDLTVSEPQAVTYKESTLRPSIAGFAAIHLSRNIRVGCYTVHHTQRRRSYLRMLWREFGA